MASGGRTRIVHSRNFVVVSSRRYAVGIGRRYVDFLFSSRFVQSGVAHGGPRRGSRPKTCGMSKHGSHSDKSKDPGS